MTQPIYEKLTDALKMRGGAAPAVHCREFYAILEELFTPDEAELASKMPMGLISAAELASETGGDPKVAEELLESMANKGLLFSYVRHDVMHYDLLQLVPGMFEMQFMTGEVSERAKRLARLFEDYFNVMQRLPRSDAGGLFPAFPWARVITVEREIPAGVEVHPYDMVSQYIEKAPYITVSTCYCRHHGELVDRPCDKPKDNCMGIGPGAKSNADRGFAKLISKEEALEILKRAEDAGLVHLSSNTGKYIDFICNCCICHCGILQSVKNAAAPSMAAVSSLIASLEEGDCSGCGDCVERCPMDALAMEDDVVALDSNRCIGCGLCVSVCPTGALKLEPREEAPLPPQDRNSLNAAMMSSIQPNT
jgi:ferredoxin